jgi:hypothetical protein
MKAMYSDLKTQTSSIATKTDVLESSIWGGPTKPDGSAKALLPKLYSKVEAIGKLVDAMKLLANVLNILPELLKAHTAFTVKYLVRRMKTEVITQVADPLRVLSNAIENRYDRITRELLKHCKYVNAVNSEVIPLIKNIEKGLYQMWCNRIMSYKFSFTI